MAHSWLKTASDNLTKPKDSIIDVLKKNVGGYKEGRSRTQLHASDLTKDDFCSRRWAIHDLQQVTSSGGYLPTALQATFDIGNATAKVFIENWAGDAVVGNWECLRCFEQRTMTTKPKGWCEATKGKAEHLWSYREVMFEDKKCGFTGSIDAIFILSTPLWVVTELKIMAATQFDSIIAPLPEHRIRTSLYMRLIEESESVWKSRFNLSEARVVYVSRGYGKMNVHHGEILPWKEYIIKRDDESTKKPIQQALALKMFRDGKGMPTGICSTAEDKIATKCNVCKECFSGQYPATIDWKEL